MHITTLDSLRIFNVSIYKFPKTLMWESTAVQIGALARRIIFFFLQVSRIFPIATLSEAIALLEGNKTEISSIIPILTSLGFAFNSILGAAKTFMGSVIIMFQYIFIFAKEVFMINPIITGTITAIIIGLLVLAFWSTIRAGR